MKPFQQHLLNWKNCTACSLCEGRRNVVLFRGQIPCDVLMIGEAPGASEDVLGSPFTGPAGHLLDEIIRTADQSRFTDFEDWNNSPSVRIGFTNLVSCIPIGDDGSKVKEPPDEAIKACAPRLQEIVEICKPRLIVCVGQLPKKWLGKVIPHRDATSVQITHPAVLLRMDASQYGLAYRQCVVTLADAFRELE